jgi:Orsellinic acid/F9775 biosynthesis cluster protein D
MNTYVTYNVDYKVLICKQHQCAISFKYLSRHLLDNHDLSLKERQNILVYASQFSIAEPKELTYSVNSIDPIPYLKIIQAHRCVYENCNVICGTLDTVKEHCKRKHGWKSKEGECWSEISAQTFYHGNDRKYFLLLLIC